MDKCVGFVTKSVVLMLRDNIRVSAKGSLV